MGSDEFFEEESKCARGGLIRGRQALRGPAAEDPGRRRVFKKFSLKFRKNYNFHAKFFDFLKSFNEKFAVFSIILKNLLEFLAKIWRNI